MVVSRRPARPACYVTYKDETPPPPTHKNQEVNSFISLGFNITSNGECIREIKIRIGRQRIALTIPDTP